MPSVYRRPPEAINHSSRRRLAVAQPRKQASPGNFLKPSQVPQESAMGFSLPCLANTANSLSLNTRVSRTIVNRSPDKNRMIREHLVSVVPQLDPSISLHGNRSKLHA